MAHGTWRAKARRRLEKLVEEHKPKTAADVRKLGREHFPWSPRKNYPYRMWCEEVKRMAEEIEHLPTPEKVKNYWLNPPLKRG